MESEEEQLPCVDKMSFESQKEAEANGLAAEWQHGGSLKSYKCKYCRLWHLASN